MSIDSSAVRSSLPVRIFRYLERWPIFWLTFAGLVAGCMGRYIHDVDMFWQLKFGEMMIADLAFPATEPFITQKHDVPHVPVCWLAQVLYAAVWKVGGWPLLQMVDSVLWCLGYAVIALSLRRNSPWHWPAAVALGFGYFTAIPFGSVRPQTFAILCYGIMVALTWSNRAAWKKVILMGLLFIFWQNVHPSVLTAGVWLGPAFLAHNLRWFTSAKEVRGRFPWEWTAFNCLAIAAAFATPDPLGMFAVAKENQSRCEFLGVSEWLTVWRPDLDFWHRFIDIDGRGNTLITYVVMAIVIPLRWRRMRWHEVVTVLIFAGLTWQWYRFAVFLGLALIPIWYRAFVPTRPPRLPIEPINYRRGIAIVGILLCLAIPDLVSRLTVRFTGYYPFEAVQAMKEKQVPPGVVYSTFFWGGLVVEAGYPEWTVVQDGRYYLFSEDEWRWFNSADVGEIPIDEIIEKYHPVCFLLRNDMSWGLIERLNEHPDWVRVEKAPGQPWFDSTKDHPEAALFVPRKP